MRLIAAIITAVVLFPLVSAGETGSIKVGVFTTDPAVINVEGKVLDYLSQRTGIQFSLTPIIGYEKSVDKLRNGKIDAAIFGSAPAYIAIMEGIAVPVVRPEARKSSVYYGYWLTLKGSGLNSVADFKGKRFAYVDPYTSAGYLFPRAAIKSKGYDPDNFFGAVKFSNTHEAAIQILLNGTVDGCAAKDTAYKKFIDANIDLKDKLKIIEVAGPFPERTLVVSKKINLAVINKIKDVLLKMGSDPEGGKLLEEIGRSRYIETGMEDFSEIKRILEILKIGNPF